MKLQLTKRRALELTRDLWKFLAQDLINDKDDFAPVNDMRFNCPCCEYAEQKTGSRVRADACMDACVACPLLSLWPYGCEVNLDTPWQIWRKAHHRFGNTDMQREEALAAAQTIADHAAQLLEQLPPETGCWVPATLDNALRGRKVRDKEGVGGVGVVLWQPMYDNDDRWWEDIEGQVRDLCVEDCEVFIPDDQEREL